MKVALIYPKLYGYQEKAFGIGGYSNIMHGYPPLSLAYTAAIIKKAGHEVTIIDGNILNYGLGKISEEIKRFSPDLLGFSLTTSTFHNILSWIRQIKNAENIPVIAGGVLLDIFPEQVMAHKEIDYAVIGSGRVTLPLFMDFFGKNGDLSRIPGLCSRRDEKSVINDREAGEDFIKLLHPARELLPNHKYYSPFSSKKNFTAFITSKGCIFRCAYCCLPGNLQLRPIADVIEEMEQCRSLGIRDLDFYDSIFTVDKARTIELCQQMRAKKFGFSWTIRTHIDYIDQELLEEMSASGCRMIMYGIESTEPAILKNLSRPYLPPNRIKDVVSLTKKTGISPFGFFMLGSPGETPQTIGNSVQFSKKAGFDFVQFSKLTVIPATQLYQDHLRLGKKDYWGSFILEGQKIPEIIVSGMPAGVILNYVKDANLGFYLDPRRLIRVVASIKSFRQFINQLKAGFKMAFSYIFKF